MPKVKLDHDPVLAEIMRKNKVKAPIEDIIESYPLMICILNPGDLEKGYQIVRLRCGHLIKTKRKRRSPCKSCHRMILNGEDYVGYRFGKDEDLIDGV